MSAAPNLDDEYKVGGALPPNATSYVIRQADTKLCEGLRAMRFCYVLNSRQMGKSSLRVQARKTLEAEGFACAEIEMRDVCSYQVTQDEFYATIVSHLVSGFELEIDYVQWWHKHTIISPFDRLSKFIQEELLEKINQRVIIFFDEIDSIINLKFKDDFFGFIRACYNRRADNPKYNHLTFVLLGVATPSDLIEDNKRTPFNIDSQAIELKGFQLHETKPLHKGLQEKVSNPEAALQWVLHWTGGQPFLTQKLCKLISDSSPIQDGDEKRFIKNLVQSRAIDNWLTHDQPEHLRTIRDRILRSGQHKDLLLELYQQILQQGEVEADDSPEQMELRLSGLVVKKDGKLRVYNRIYQEIFDQNWVNRALGEGRSVAIQNPAILPETGQEGHGRIVRDRQTTLSRFSLPAVLLASVVVTFLVMGVRLLSLLQPLELKMFDWMLQLRPAEKRDERLLIVKVTTEDVERLGGKYPLEDKTLLRLLRNLQKHQPQVIGLDIYRNWSVGEGRNDFVKYLQNSKFVIPICVYSSKNHQGVPPPPGLPEQRPGFADVSDASDNIVRNHLLAMEPPDKSPCSTGYAFSVQLAYRYLEAKRKPFTFIPTLDTWQFGSVRFELLKAHKGFYQQEEITAGHQILLNYRLYKSSLEDIAEQATLTQVLTNRVEPNLIRGRIILIGVTDSTLYRDEHNTPYNQEIPGLWLHAQMVSQLISTVEDGRPLLWFLPLWGDAIWVWVWALVGGLLSWRLRAQLFRVLTIGIFGIALSGISFLLLLENGLLVPLVPSALAVMTTVGIVPAKFTARTQRQKMNDE
jgi:CHASE2 domain-containing sensor protein